MYKYLFAILFYIFFGLYRFAPSFATDAHTTAFPGDGWANIGGIFDVYDTINRKGLGSILSDSYYSLGLGGGLNNIGIPINALWQSIYYCLSFFFEANDVYDIIGYLGLILIGLSGIFLGQTLRLSFLISFCMSFALISIENFTDRMLGHLGLAIYFMPIFLLAFCLRFSENPTHRNLISLSFILWLTLYFNEYYGYYGCFIGLVSIIIGIFLYAPQKYIEKKFWKSVSKNILFLFILMALSYPNIISKRLMQKTMGIQSEFSAIFHHSKGEFFSYAAEHFLTAFSPRVFNFNSLFTLTKDSAGGENSFGVGTLVLICIPLFILLSLITCWIQEDFSPIKKTYRKALILTSMLFVSICLSLKPDHPWSLSWFTAQYAPMFRVNIRALLYTDIAAIALTFLCIQMFIDSFKKPAQQSTKMNLSYLLAYSFALCCSIACIYDIGGSTARNFQSLRISNLGTHEEYQALDQKPEGMLLELPFHSPGSSPPEADYPYYIARLRHKQPIFNGGLPHKGNFHTTLRRVSHYLEWGSLSQSGVHSLKKAGIRYIVCHKDRFDIKPLQDIQGLTEIDNNEKVAIFSIDQVEHLDFKKIKSEVWSKSIEIPARKMHILSGEMIPSPFDHSKILKAHRPNGEHAISLFGPYLPLETGSYEITIPLAKISDDGPNTNLAFIEISGSGVPEDAGSQTLQAKDLSKKKFNGFIFHFSLPNPADLEIRLHTLSTHPILMGTTLIKRTPEHQSVSIL